MAVEIQEASIVFSNGNQIFALKGFDIDPFKILINYALRIAETH